jgi:hypothetical protein
MGYRLRIQGFANTRTIVRSLERMSQAALVAHVRDLDRQCFFYEQGRQAPTLYVDSPAAAAPGLSADLSDDTMIFAAARPHR